MASLAMNDGAGPVQDLGKLFVAAVGCGLFLAACTPGPKQLHNLELACETIKCICAKTDTGIFAKRQTTAVLWHESGSAYCPRGYALEKASD